MKNNKLIFSVSLFALLLSTNTEAAHSKIICNYQQINHQYTKPLTFNAQDDVDLTNPNGDTILLHVNGDKEATLFNVKKTILHVGYEIVYSHYNQFFVSDLNIKYAEQYGTTSLNGSWKSDYPYDSDFICVFLN